MENRKNYFTTGEFAKLCGTTKATLFHYDEQGVLKPEVTGENGYRYYGARQYLDFDMIQVLQDAGSSLREIKEYSQNHNPENFAAMLKEKRKNLREERKKLARMERRLEAAILLTEAALSKPREVVSVEWQEEEHLVIVPIGEDQSLERQMKVMGEHFHFCRENGLGEDLPLGSIVRRDDLLQGKFEDSFYYSRIRGPVDSPRYYKKPAGMYLTMFHKGFYDTVPEAFAQMLRYGEENGYCVIGNAYELDAIGYLAVGSEEEFVLLLSVQVEKTAAG